MNKTKQEIQDLVSAGMADLAAGQVVSQEDAKKRLWNKVNPDLRDLVAHLAEFLDDDQWNNIEPMLNAVEDILDTLRARVSELEGWETRADHLSDALAILETALEKIKTMTPGTHSIIDAQIAAFAALHPGATYEPKEP